MIDALRQNIDTELKMLFEISQYSKRLEYADASEQKLLLQAISALKNGIKIINANVPKLLANVTITQKLPSKTQQQIPIKQVRFKSAQAEVAVTLQEQDRERFLKELSISEQLIKRLKKKPEAEKEAYEEFQAARGYLKLSNKFFLESALMLIGKGYFKSLSLEFKKANLDILLSTYIAMMLFSTLLFFFGALIFTALLFFLKVGLAYPFISLAETLSFSRFLKIIWIPFVIPLAVFFTLYIYPSTEKSSLAKRIEQELPFAVIHMSAIAGSGIEPTQIFKIIGLSREYPFLRREIRKILNQINLYGYDLVTALNTIAATTPSDKLSELFSGLSTTITSGGSMPDFFEKRAETLLISYRLEREKYTKIAETFMDIYISLVIATPMILMIMLVIISVSQLNTGLAPAEMTLLIILIISVLNCVFIGFLHIKQPAY